MRKKIVLKTLAVLLTSSLLFSSCLGSFTLTKKLHAWNSSAGSDKWVNELIFIALSAVQVYSVSLFIDGVILNSIEFWTGENPAETAETKQVRTESGLVTITTNAQGHTIQQEGSAETLAFRFDAEANAWSFEAGGQSAPLLQWEADNQAKVYLADGSTLTVSADRAGVLALQQALNSRIWLAAK